MNRYKKSKLNKITLSAGIILLALIIIIGLEVTNTTHFLHKSAIVRAPATPIAKLPASSPNSKTASGSKVPSSSTTQEKGTPVDKNGQVPSNTPTDPTKWSTSSSGAITVKLPSGDTKIQSGSALSGSASVAQVQYRLIDNNTGVISQGPINVVNGNFTASITFESHSSSGRLDVFSTDSYGRELNEVQIPVNF